MRPFPVRIGVFQRVVHAVGVPVEVLGAARILHVVVHREEGAGDGVIDPSVHVDEPVTHQMLVSGEAAVEEQGGGLYQARAVAVVGRAPGVETHVLHHQSVAVGDGGPAAEMVGMDVVEPVVCETLLHVPEIILSGG